MNIKEKLRTYKKLVMFEHTVFALPFAYMGLLFACNGLPGLRLFFLVTFAMFTARTFAMAANRYIDRFIDSENPRTASRPIQEKKVGPSEVLVIAFVSLLFFEITAWILRPDYLYLTPLLVFVLVFYSYTKRFTWLCHFFLGGAIGVSPFAAWITAGRDPEPGIILFSAAVCLWIAGFDIIYSLQDYGFDRGKGLFSVPVRFGIKGALVISAAVHLFSLVLFVFSGLLLDAGFMYFTGFAAAAVIVVYEHSIVSPGDLSRIDFAFFNLNGLVSIIFFFSLLAGFCF